MLIFFHFTLPGNEAGSNPADVYAKWQVDGRAILDAVAAKEPAKFFQVVATMLPKHSKHEHTMKMELMSDAELAQIILDCEDEISQASAQAPTNDRKH